MRELREGAGLEICPARPLLPGSNLTIQGPEPGSEEGPSEPNKQKHKVQHFKTEDRKINPEMQKGGRKMEEK